MATVNQVIEGLKILSKYCNPDGHHMNGEHDEILGPDTPEEKVPLEELLELEKLGWEYSNDYGRWYLYT